MKRIVIVAMVALAIWTGRSEQRQSVTYQMGWNCEYMVYGQTFWAFFLHFCPPQIEVN